MPLDVQRFEPWLSRALTCHPALAPAVRRGHLIVMNASDILWRRLDVPGHDACRLEETAGGWRLAGVTVFLHEGAPAQLAYEVASDRAWRSREGHVRGWLGGKAVGVSVSRSPGGVWMLDGAPVPGLEGCEDLDFGFTPATNLFQLRRLALAPGQARDCPVAWLDDAARTLTFLPQRYERRSELTYWYESPTSDYAGLLELTPAGFARVYPGLWQREGDGPS
jgi:uncharacterized protein